jgi:hypothetical protein
MLIYNLLPTFRKMLLFQYSEYCNESKLQPVLQGKYCFNYPEEGGSKLLRKVGDITSQHSIIYSGRL